MFTLYTWGGDVLQNSITKRIRKEAKLGLEFIRMWPCIVQLGHKNRRLEFVVFLLLQCVISKINKKMTDC